MRHFSLAFYNQIGYTRATMKHTPKPQNPSRADRRRAETLFNKQRCKELKAMERDEVRPGVARFRPAEPRAREGGWTAERQRAFIEALADTGCVRTAASEVKLSPRSAYSLRRHPTAYAFRHAWERAMDHACRVMADNATARAVNGRTVVRLHKGEVVHEEVVFNERLVTRLLASRDPYRFGARVDLSRSERLREASADSFLDALDAIESEEGDAMAERASLLSDFEAARNPNSAVNAEEGRRALEAKLDEMAERLAAPMPPGLVPWERAADDWPPEPGSSEQSTTWREECEVPGVERQVPPPPSEGRAGPSVRPL